MKDNLHPIFQNILNSQLQLHDVMQHLNYEVKVNEEQNPQTKKCRLRFCDSDIVEGKWVKSCGECQHYR